MNIIFKLIMIIVLNLQWVYLTICQSNFSVRGCRFTSLWVGVYNFILRKRGSLSFLVAGPLVFNGESKLFFGKLLYGFTDIVDDKDLIDVLTNTDLLLLFFYGALFFILFLLLLICIFIFFKWFWRFSFFVSYYLYIIMQIIIFQRWYILLNIYRNYLKYDVRKRMISYLLGQYKKYLIKYKSILKVGYFICFFVLLYWIGEHVIGFVAIEILLTKIAFYLKNFWFFIKIYNVVVYLTLIYYNLFNHCFFNYVWFVNDYLHPLSLLFIDIIIFCDLFSFLNLLSSYVYFFDYYVYGTILQCSGFQLSYYLYYCYFKLLTLYYSPRRIVRHYFFFKKFFVKYWIGLLYIFVVSVRFFSKMLLLYFSFYENLILIFFKLPLILMTIYFFFYFFFFESINLVFNYITIFNVEGIHFFFSCLNISLYSFLVSIAKFSLVKIYIGFFINVISFLYLLVGFGCFLFKIYLGFFIKIVLIVVTYILNLSLLKVWLIIWNFFVFVKAYLLILLYESIVFKFFLFFFNMLFIFINYNLSFFIKMIGFLLGFIFTYWKFVVFNFMFFLCFFTINVYLYILVNKIDIKQLVLQIYTTLFNVIFFENIYVMFVFYISKINALISKAIFEIRGLWIGKPKARSIKIVLPMTKPSVNYVLLFIYDKFVYIYYFYISNLLKLYKMYVRTISLSVLIYRLSFKKLNLTTNLYLYDDKVIGGFYFNEMFKDIRFVLPKFNLNYFFLNEKYLFLYDKYIVRKYFDNFFVELLAFMVYSRTEAYNNLSQQKNILKFLLTLFDVDVVKIYNFFYEYERVAYSYYKAYHSSRQYSFGRSALGSLNDLVLSSNFSSKEVKSESSFSSVEVNKLTSNLNSIKGNPVLNYLYGDFFFSKKDYMLFYNTEFFDYYSLVLLKKFYSLDFFIKNIFYELLLTNDESTSNGLIGVDLSKSVIFDKLAKNIKNLTKYESLNYLYFDEAHLYSDLIRTYIKVLQSYSKKFHKYEKREIISLLGVSLLDLDMRFREDLINESVVLRTKLRNVYTKNTRLFKCIDTHKSLGYVDKVSFYLYPELEEVYEKHLYSSVTSFYREKKKNFLNKSKGSLVDKGIDFFDLDYLSYGFPSKFYYRVLEYYFEIFPNGLYPKSFFFDPMLYQLKKNTDEQIFSKFYLTKRKFNRLNILYRFEDSFYDDYTFYWWNLIHVDHTYKIRVDEYDKPYPDFNNVGGGEIDDLGDYIDAKAELDVLQLKGVAVNEEGAQVTLFTEEFDDFLDTHLMKRQLKTEFIADDQDDSIFTSDMVDNIADWFESYMDLGYIVLTREEELRRVDEEESCFKDCEIPSSILNRQTKHSYIFNALISKRVDFKQDRLSWFLVDVDDVMLTDEYLKTQRFFFYDYLNLHEFVFNVQFDEYKKKFINTYSIQFLFDVILYYTYNRNTRLYNTKDEIYFEILNQFNHEAASLWDIYFFMLYNEPYDLKHVRSNFVFNKYKSLFFQYDFKNKNLKYKVKGHLNNSFALSDYAWYNNTDILIGSDNFEVDSFDNRYISFEELMSRDNFFKNIVSGPKRDIFLEDFFNSIDKYYNNSVSYQDELMISFDDIPSILESYDETVGHWYYADGEKFAYTREPNFNDETKGFFEAEFKPYFTDLQVSTFTFEWNNGYDVTQGFANDDYLEVSDGDVLLPTNVRMHKIGEEFYRHQDSRSEFRNVPGSGLTYGLLDLENYVIGDFDEWMTEFLVEEEDSFFSVHGLSSSSSYSMLNQHLMNVFKYSGLVYNHNYKQLDFFMLNTFFDYYVYTMKASSLNYILKTEYKLLLPKYYCFGPFGEEFELKSNLFLYSNKRHQVSSTGLKKRWYYIALVKELVWCKLLLYGFWFFDFIYYKLDSNLDNVYVDFRWFNFRFYYGYYIHAFYMFFYIIYRYCSSLKVIFANVEYEEDYGEWATGLFMYNYLLQIYEDLGLVFNISEQFALRTQNANLMMHDTERGWWNGSVNLYEIVHNEMDDYMGYTDEDFEVTSSVLKSFGVNGFLADMDNRYFMQKGNFSFLYFFAPNASLFVEAFFYLYFLRDLVIIVSIRLLDYFLTDFCSFIIVKIQYVFNLFLISIEFVLFVVCSFVLYLRMLFINIFIVLYKIWSFFSVQIVLLLEKLFVFEFMFYLIQIWLLPFELVRVFCVCIYNKIAYIYPAVSFYIAIDKIYQKFNYIIYILVKYSLILIFKFFCLYLLLVLLFDYYDLIVIFFESVLPVKVHSRTMFFIYIILIFINLVFLLHPFKLSKWLWSTRYLFLFLVIVLWVYSGVINSPHILFSQLWGLMNLKTDIIFGDLFFEKAFYPFMFDWTYNHYFRTLGLFTTFNLNHTYDLVDRLFLDPKLSPFVVLPKILYYDIVAVLNIITGFFYDIRSIYYKIYRMLLEHDIFVLMLRFVKLYYMEFKSILIGSEENILLYYIYIYPRYMSFFDYFYNIFSIQVNTSLTRYHFARIFYENFGVAPFGSLYLLLVFDVSNKLALSYYRNVFSLLRKDLWGNYRVDLNNMFMFYQRGALAGDRIDSIVQHGEVAAFEADAHQYNQHFEVDLLGNYAFTTTIEPDMYMPTEPQMYSGKDLVPYQDFGHYDENDFLEKIKRDRVHKAFKAHHVHRVNVQRLKYRRASEVLARRYSDLLKNNKKLTNDLGTYDTLNFWKTKSMLNKEIEANNLKLAQCMKYLKIYKGQTGETTFNKERVNDVGRHFDPYEVVELRTGYKHLSPETKIMVDAPPIRERSVREPKKYYEAPVVHTRPEAAYIKRKSRLDAYYFTRYTGNQFYYRKYRMIYDLYEQAYLYFPYTAAGVFKSDNSTFSVRYPNNRFILDDDGWREEDSDLTGGLDMEHPHFSKYHLLDGRSYYFRYLVPDLGFIGSTHWASHWKYLHMDTSYEDFDYLFFRGSARSPHHAPTSFVR